jgi:hypothetical protein
MKANEFSGPGDMRASQHMVHLYAQVPEHYAHPPGLEISLAMPGYAHFHPAAATYTTEALPEGHTIELGGLDAAHFQAQSGGVSHQEYGLAIAAPQQHLHPGHAATIDYHGVIHTHGGQLVTSGGAPPPGPPGMTHWAPIQEHLDPGVFITDQPLSGVLVDGMVCHQPIGMQSYHQHHPQSIHTGVGVGMEELDSGSESSTQLHIGPGKAIDKRPLKPWTEEENHRLKAAVKRYGERSWRKIAEEVPGRTSVQCLQHWKHVLSPDVGKGAWTAEEDAELVRLVQEKGYKWAEIAKELPGRIGKRCRERYMNHLNPELRKVSSR